MRGPKSPDMKKIIALFREALSGEEKDFTSGSINRAILLLSIPMVLEMVMESLFAVVDVFFVAQIGVEAVATVGITEAVATLIYSFAIGISTAPAAFVARRTGEHNPEQAAVGAAQAVWIALSLSVLIGLGGLFFAEDILRLMGADAEVVRIGSGYTRIILGGNLVIMLLFLLNGVFRGAGDAALAMRSLWLANGINIVLDPIFIFGWGPVPAMGVEGAAIATTIGRGVGVAFQLYILFGGRSLVKLARRHFAIQWSVIWSIFRVAASGAFQFIVASASWIVLMAIIAQLGSEAVAGYTIAIRLIVFSILPSWGLGNAAATLVGQNLGAHQPQRAETSVWRSAFFNMVFLTSVGLVFFAFARPIIGLFSQEPAVMEAGVITLRVICLGYLFFSYGMVLSQAFNGAGDTLTPMFINLFCFWLMEIPLGYLLAIHLGMGLTGVCLSVAISETALAVIAILIFRRGRWKQVRI